MELQKKLQTFFWNFWNKSLELTQGLKKHYKLGEDRTRTTREFQSISVQRIQMVPAIVLHIPVETIVWSPRLKSVAKFVRETSVKWSHTLNFATNDEYSWGFLTLFEKHSQLL